MKTKFVAGLVIAALLQMASETFARPGYWSSADNLGGRIIYHQGNTAYAAYPGAYYSSYYGAYPYAGADAGGPYYQYRANSTNRGALPPNLNVEVQEALTRMGYYDGPFDGNVAGSRTVVAIESFQRDKRLPITGAVDGNLVDAMFGR